MDNIDKIWQLFPNVITETNDENGCLQKTVDFDLLRQELSGAVVEGDKERYQLTWPGKKMAIALANSPIAKTLRPEKGKSLDWDKTKNLYIEGDNLEALKLLQECYLNKIKCIYIDPPYNTGKDFIYRDNFRQGTKEYLNQSGQIDSAGNRLFQNNESNGRFHSDWLTMMYSRLKLARNLLKEDGTIFISIDDNELDNLKKICDEIFGENNFVARIVVYSNPRGRQSASNIAPTHEYLLIYARDIHFCNLKGLGLTPEQVGEYNREDAKGRYREIGLRLRGGRAAAAESPTLHFPIYYDVDHDEILLEKVKDNLVEIIPKFEDGTLGTWRWSREKIIKDMEYLFVRSVQGRNGELKYDVFQKDYLTGDKTRKVKSLWDEKDINYDRGAEEIREIFGKKLFDYSKPLFMLKKIISIASDQDSLVLDFFSGSAAAAHAVMQLNAEDGGSRKYIMVQLPELTDEDSEAFKNGYKNICEIGRERIRRAAEKLREETNANIDYGYRVFRIDTSNMKDVYYIPDKLKQQDLFFHESNIKEDRQAEDILTQVMIQSGLELSLTIEAKNIEGNAVYFVGGNCLAACFDKDVPENVIKSVAAEKPLRIVFLDSSFAADSDRLNFEEIFKTISPVTEIKVI